MWLDGHDLGRDALFNPFWTGSVKHPFDLKSPELQRGHPLDAEFVVVGFNPSSGVDEWLLEKIPNATVVIHGEPARRHYEKLQAVHGKLPEAICVPHLGRISKDRFSELVKDVRRRREKYGVPCLVLVPEKRRWVARDKRI